jgi:hypothetical protein
MFAFGDVIGSGAGDAGCRKIIGNLLGYLRYGCDAFAFLGVRGYGKSYGGEQNGNK